MPHPTTRPREKPLSRSQSLRVIKKKPLVREVRGEEGTGEVGCPGTSAWTSHGVPVLSPTGHLTLPEGPDKEKDCVLRHGQLGATKPAQSYTSCPAGRWGCLEGPSGCTSGLPAPAAQALPSWLLQLVEGQGQVLWAIHRDELQCTKADCTQGSIYCLSPPSTFSVMGPETSPGPCECNQSPPNCVLPSCPSKYLTAFAKACVCVLVCIVLVNEVRFVQVLIINM